MAWVCVVLTAGGLLGATAGSAAETIGKTAVSRNIVEQVATTPAAIQVGDNVFANENVRTGEASAAKFVFSDETNLALGATSTVKLDRFVYKGQSSYLKAAVNFTAGAFRFTTGGSEKGAYQLKTTTATIGVRGTVFDVLVAGGETTITLVEGAVDICPRKEFDGNPRKLSKAQRKAFHCVELNQVGQTASVTSRRASLKSIPFSFADAAGCDGGLCGTTTTAELTQPAGGGGGLMCYMKQE
jgi:hypothetical protein